MKISDFQARPGRQGLTGSDQGGFVPGPVGADGTQLTGPAPLDPISVLAEMEETGQFTPPWLLPIDHFSASSLNMLEICPRQWQQRYILGRKEPPGQSLVLGSVTHGGIEFGLDEKLLTETEPKLDDMLVYYHDNVWRTTLDRYGGESEVIWDDKPEQVRKKGAELVTAYYPRIETLEPEAVEHEFRLDVGLQVPIHGYIDLIQKSGRPTIDWKTSSKRRPSLKPDWRVQARVYQLVVPRAVDFHQITTAKTPEVITGLETDEMVERYSAKLALQTITRLAEALTEANRFYATYGPEDPWPMRGIHHDWRCSPKWCAYRKDCPIWIQ
jgi:hypothetical protein